MAGSKNSSSGVSTEEIQELITAFQKQNSCRISMEFSVGIMGGVESLEIVAWAWNNRSESGEPPLLGSASVRCSALRMATLEGAIIRVLYALDSQLAWGELPGGDKLSA